MNYLSLHLLRMWYLKHSFYSLINILQRSKKNFISAINQCICWHICKLIYVGCFIYFSAPSWQTIPYVQLQKNLILLILYVLKGKESSNSFWKYYGSFFLEAVANMQITYPKPFSSAKFPKRKHAANLCTHILSWEQSRGHSSEKNDT